MDGCRTHGLAVSDPKELGPHEGPISLPSFIDDLKCPIPVGSGTDLLHHPFHYTLRSMITIGSIGLLPR